MKLASWYKFRNEFFVNIPPKWLKHWLIFASGSFWIKKNKIITGGAHERVLFLYPQILKFQTFRASKKLILLGISFFLGLIPNRATILDIVQSWVNLSYIPQIPPQSFFTLPQIPITRGQTTTLPILPNLSMTFQSPTHQQFPPKDHPTILIKPHILPPPPLPSPSPSPRSPEIPSPLAGRFY